MTIAEQYAKETIKSNQGKYIKLACQKFLSDLKRNDLIFDEAEAIKPVNFFEKYLCHWEGTWRGKPLILEPWQKFVLMQVFGWKWKDSGLRRIRSAYVQIARKNAKTTLAAGIALYHLCADHENTPQILVGANNEDQAKICVNSCGRIIENSPELLETLGEELDLFKYKDNIVNIVYKERNGVIKAMSKEPGTKDGFNPSLGIIDEYHEADTDKLLNVLESGQGARPEPLLFCITTAGFNRFGPCYSKLRDVSVKILQGALEDDSHLGIIFEPDEGDDWKDEKTWMKSNPNLNVSVYKQYLKSRFDKAVNEGGSKEVDFKTKNLNTWTDSPVVFIQDETWIKNTTGQEYDLKDISCFGGLYTSSSESLNCFILYFPDVKGKHVFKCWTWLPEKYVKENNDNVDYQKWIDEGFITETPGTDHDHIKIANDVLEICQNYLVQIIGFEQMFAQYVAPELDAGGYSVMQINQGFTHLGQQTALFKKLSKEGNIEHFGNPILRWHVANTVIHKNSKDGTEKPDRGASGSRIGAVSACLNAMVAKFEWEKLYGKPTDEEMKFESV